MTSLLWLVVGIYMVVNPASETWRLVGIGVVGLGLMRAYLAARSWNAGKDSRRDEE